MYFSSNNKPRSRQFRAGTCVLGCHRRLKGFSAFCSDSLHVGLFNSGRKMRGRSKEEQTGGTCQPGGPFFVGKTIALPEAPPCRLLLHLVESRGQFRCKGVWGGFLTSCTATPNKVRVLYEGVRRMNISSPILTPGMCHSQLERHCLPKSDFSLSAANT